jgi:hypothetical protein
VDTEIRLLGPVGVSAGGVARPLPGLRRKAVLAVHTGQPVSTDRIVDVVCARDGGQRPSERRLLPAPIPRRRGPDRRRRREASSDVAVVPYLREQRDRLEQLRVDALEGLGEARLALGEHAETVARPRRHSSCPVGTRGRRPCR